MSFYDEDNDDLLGYMNNLLTTIEKHLFVLRTKLRRNKYSEIFVKNVMALLI